jgi:hypothetical protein
MKPLNFAILKYVTTVKEACADDVISALKGQYGSFKALSREGVVEALMTAEQNGLVQEKRFDLDSKGDLRIYYQAHAEGAATINKYIPD